MSFDLGDPVPLAFAPVDVGGNPVDVGVATCTVTLPDASTATPAVVHGGLGAYSATYVAAQAGRHRVNWTATAPNAQGQIDTFYVLGTDPGLLISLQQARTGLRVPTGQHLDDEDLRDLIASATAPMEDLCGPIVPRACDEWHDGGGQTVRLLQAPVRAIASVTECYGAGYARALTLQVLDGGAFDAFGYDADLLDGIITRRTSGVAAAFVGGRRNIHVVYTAGRSSVPPNLIRATRRLVRWLWQTEMQGQRPPNQGPDAPTTTPSGFMVPNAVKELCAGELRIPGIG